MEIKKKKKYYSTDVEEIRILKKKIYIYIYKKLKKDINNLKEKASENHKRKKYACNPKIMRRE